MKVGGTEGGDAMTRNVRLLDNKGLRKDGRRLDELRHIKMEAGILKRADGSCYINWGKNKIIAAVYGPRQAPRYVQEPHRAVVQCWYNMAAFSVSSRKKPGMDRRSTEISKILSEALGHVIMLDRFPRSTIDVYITVLESDGGTRCAALTAASVALADAGIPMKGLISAVACGKVDGALALDLSKIEDNLGQADLPIGYVPSTDEVVLLQMDGHMTPEEFDDALDMGIESAKKIYELQRDTLIKRYSTPPLKDDVYDGGGEQ